MNKIKYVTFFLILQLAISSPAFAMTYNLTGNMVWLGGDSYGDIGDFELKVDTFTSVNSASGVSISAISGVFLGANVTGLSVNSYTNNLLWDLPIPFLTGISFNIAPSFNGPLGNSDFASLRFKTSILFASFGSLSSEITPSTYVVGNLKLTEVTNVTSVPEPETYALFLAGITLIGLIKILRKTS